MSCSCLDSWKKGLKDGEHREASQWANWHVITSPIKRSTCDTPKLIIFIEINVSITSTLRNTSSNSVLLTQFYKRQSHIQLLEGDRFDNNKKLFPLCSKLLVFNNYHKKVLLFNTIIRLYKSNEYKNCIQ